MKSKADIRTDDKDDGKNYWFDLEKRFPELNVREQYELAKSKLGRHPPRTYFEEWLSRAVRDILPLPPREWCAPRQLPWLPPSKEDVLEYCVSKRWTASFGRHAWSTFIASNWRHYGEPITS